MILGWTLCGDGGDGHLRVCGVRVSDLGEAAFGEDVQADVAAHLGPFVVLLGEHGADQADQGGPVGKDADDVGAAADLTVQSFLVGSAWGAVSALQPVRFPRPPTEPDVPVPGHPALHGFMPMGLGWVWLLTMAMRCLPGSGSG